MYPTVIVKGSSGLLVVLLVLSEVHSFIFEDEGGTEFCSRVDNIHQNESTRKWLESSCDVGPKIELSNNLISLRSSRILRENLRRTPVLLKERRILLNRHDTNSRKSSVVDQVRLQNVEKFKIHSNPESYNIPEKFMRGENRPAWKGRHLNRESRRTRATRTSSSWSGNRSTRLENFRTAISLNHREDRSDKTFSRRSDIIRSRSTENPASSPNKNQLIRFIVTQNTRSDGIRDIRPVDHRAIRISEYRLTRSNNNAISRSLNEAIRSSTSNKRSSRSSDNPPSRYVDIRYIRTDSNELRAHGNRGSYFNENRAAESVETRSIRLRENHLPRFDKKSERIRATRSNEIRFTRSVGNLYMRTNANRAITSLHNRVVELDGSFATRSVDSLQTTRSSENRATRSDDIRSIRSIDNRAARSNEIRTTRWNDIRSRSRDSLSSRSNGIRSSVNRYSRYDDNAEFDENHPPRSYNIRTKRILDNQSVRSNGFHSTGPDYIPPSRSNENRYTRSADTSYVRFERNGSIRSASNYANEFDENRSIRSVENRAIGFNRNRQTRSANTKTVRSIDNRSIRTDNTRATRSDDIRVSGSFENLASRSNRNRSTRYDDTLYMRSGVIRSLDHRAAKVDGTSTRSIDSRITGRLNDNLSIRSDYVRATRSHDKRLVRSDEIRSIRLNDIRSRSNEKRFKRSLDSHSMKSNSNGAESSTIRGERRNMDTRTGAVLKESIDGNMSSRRERIFSAVNGRVSRNYRELQRAEDAGRRSSLIILSDEGNSRRLSQEVRNSEENEIRVNTLKNMRNTRSINSQRFVRETKKKSLIVRSGENRFERIRQFGNDKRQRQNSRMNSDIHRKNEDTRVVLVVTKLRNTFEQGRSSKTSGRSTEMYRLDEHTRRQNEHSRGIRVDSRRIERINVVMRSKQEADEARELKRGPIRAGRKTQEESERDDHRNVINRETLIRNNKIENSNKRLALLNSRKKTEYFNTAAFRRAHSRFGKVDAEEYIRSEDRIVGISSNGSFQFTLAIILAGQLIFYRLGNSKAGYFNFNWIRRMKSF